MAVIFSYGFILAISIVIGLVFTIIGLFLGHIILFDSIFLAAISGIVCNQIIGIHPAICIVIGLVLFGFLFWLQNTKAGFWIIGVLFSVLWAFVFGFLAYIFSSEDMTLVLCGYGAWICYHDGIAFKGKR